MIEYWLNADIPTVTEMTGRFFSQDDDANLIGVVAKEDLPQTIKANVIKPDGTTIEVVGESSGKRAWVVLPDDAYDTVGNIGVFIRAEKDGDVITLGGVEGYVYPSTTGSEIT